MFTATFLKYIQLLHVLIGQSLQSSDRDVRVGGACGVRDGGARVGVRDGEVHGVSFSSATPSLVLELSFCNDWPASNVFTATFLKYIQLLHALIDQSPQPSDRDVRGGEDCVWNGGSCGVRDGDAHSGFRDGGACSVSFLNSAPSWVLEISERGSSNGIA